MSMIERLTKEGFIAELQRIESVLHRTADEIINVRAVISEEYDSSGANNDLFGLVFSCRNVARSVKEVHEKLKDFSDAK